VPPWVIVGCGYTGARLAGRLASSSSSSSSGVTVTRRTLEAAQATAAAIAPTVRAAALTLGEPAPWLAGAIAVICAPPGPDPAGEVRAVVAAGPARLVYLSSTGVYAAGAGASVDERWPIEPTTASGRARALAEAALDGNAIALRVAGIYGPGRGLVERMRVGTYRVVGDGTGHVSRIHVDDLVEAIVRAGTCELRGAVNIADDDPAPIGEVADAVAALLGVPPPPRVPIASVPAEVAGMLTADRRIANARMKRELGVTLCFPSWRDGVAAELRD
jgi:dTDP-4-dehydrorhamnose reductase